MPTPPPQPGCPPRVLHLNTESGSRGGERQTLLLVEALHQRGVPSLVVAQPHSWLLQAARQQALPVEPLPMRGEVDVLAAVRLAALIRRHRIHLVHNHTSHAHLLGAVAARLAGRRAGRLPATVVTRRVDFSIYRRSFFGLNHLKYRYGIDRYILVSEAVRQVLLKDGLPPERMRVVHSGIEAERFARESSFSRPEWRKQLELPPQALLVGMVAALVGHKDHRTLLQAAAQVVRARPDTHFLVVGDGPLRSRLTALQGQLGVRGQLTFTGSRADVPQLLGQLDIYCHTSTKEALGTAILEAMAAGLPVVATRAGGIPEVVRSEETGLLVPSQDAGAVAEAVLRLADSPEDRRRMGQAGQARVRAAFSGDAMVRGTIAVYKELLPGCWP